MGDVDHAYCLYLLYRVLRVDIIVFDDFLCLNVDRLRIQILVLLNTVYYYKYSASCHYWQGLSIWSPHSSECQVFSQSQRPLDEIGSSETPDPNHGQLHRDTHEENPDICFHACL